MGDVSDAQRRWRLRALIGVALVLVVGGLVVVSVLDGDEVTPPGDESASSAVIRPDATTATSRGSTTTEAPSTTASTTTTALVIPPSSGTFTRAAGSGPVHGTGNLHTYDVEVEDGAGVDAAVFAAVVDGILADDRGWTAAGGVAFQRVASGGSFTITLATPDTTDAICLPLRTNGRFSCHEGNRIVINLRRWMEGTTDLPLSVADYRANVINHEVGHELGHGHVGCPGAGKRAPVMMQQSKGLLGCVANSWPTLDGT